ncbi:MAG TPA: hypothetical protein VM012_15080 [Flavitalea sp.]|nr:hypothetical protein [Flavitalea sp.]
MPEGPSIVILKEAVQEFKGKRVLFVSGNSKVNLQRVLFREILDFKSWGKHFLICFDGFTVRIHFLLFGTYRINETKPSPPRMHLRFSNGQLNFYACSIQFIEGSLDDVYDWSGDIMNTQWDAKSAIKKLKAQPETLVLDALLDQQVFAGSGNIFKNEVPFRIEVHPLSRIGALPPAKLNELVNQTHQYSFDFYEWKKRYVLRKNWKAHTKRTCPRCQIPLVKEYLGKTNRRTFYCPSCQVLYK